MVISKYDDFNSNESKNWEVNSYLDTSNKLNINEDLQSILLNKKGKIIILFKGNFESLIFEAEQFDVYVSNLCFTLCRDPDRAIQEADRVVKHRGTATTSKWSKKEDTKFAFVLINQVFAEFGYIPPVGSRSSFDSRKILKN